MASGASGEKKTYHLCHKEQKKEELNPKAEQPSAMQLGHQSPVRNFIRKLKATFAVWNGGRPGSAELGGQLGESAAASED